MRKTLSLLTIISLFLPLATSAATPVTSGDLIKASGDTVYYFGANGKRYVFPTAKTYASWYANFSTVKTVSDTEIATYPLGGNVTYRPGVRLVKVTTDPKVYAVAKNGALRWIQSEDIASSLYGADWSKKVDDLPDAFFVNYRISTPIAMAPDFSPTNETAMATTINADKDLITASTPQPTPTPTPAPTPTPTSTSNYSVSLETSNPTPRVGDIVNLSATAQPSGSLQRINLYFDDVLQKTCAYYSPCSVGITIPGTKTSYAIRAETDWIDAHHVTSTDSIQIATGGNAGVTISISTPEVRPNTQREAVAIIETSLASAKTVEIYIDGNLVQACDNNSVCRYTALETSPIGTIHSVYALSRDVVGVTKRSNSKTISVVTNDHPVVAVTPGKTSLNQGETLDVTVTGNDSDGIASTEIWLDSALVKHCDSSTCIAIAGPWTRAHTLIFTGRAQDTLGLSAKASSTHVTVL